MKTLCLIHIILLSYISFAQDQIKLLNQNEPFEGKVVLIKTSTVEFQQNSTGFKYEFNKSDIDYIVSELGDTVWFKSLSEKKEIAGFYDPSPEEINPFNEFKRLTFFFAYNFSGNHEVSLGSSSGSLDVNPAISVGLEFDIVKTNRDIFKLGLGAIYQFPRKQLNIDGKFNFIPIYTFIKLSFINEDKVKAYFYPTLGFNIFEGDNDYTGGFNLNGGLYNSLGIGFLVNNKLDLKVVYQYNRGFADIEILKDEIEVIYTSFGIYFGYYF